MSLDIQKLQSLYKRDALARAIIDTLEDEGASQVPEVTELGGGYVTVPAFATLDEKQCEREIIKALKAIQKTGCGTYIAAGDGKANRMSWDLEPQEIHAFATGGGEPLVEVEVATLPELGKRFPNLETCVRSAPAKRWRAPVVAAARAGLWEDDVASAEWRKRLDRLQRAL